VTELTIPPLSRELVDGACMVLKAAYADGAVKFGASEARDICEHWREVTPTDRYAITNLLYWLHNNAISLGKVSHDAIGDWLMGAGAGQISHQ
jgi:hypothetical protein